MTPPNRPAVPTFNWLDDGIYPYPKSKDWARWAWEFLRRSRRYQREYRQFLEHNQHARKLGDHPLPDGTPLDHFFTFPKAEPGQTLGDFLAQHSDAKSTYMFWDEYIRRMWWLDLPVDPSVSFDKGKVQFKPPPKWKRNTNLTSLSVEARKNPIDFPTELAPREILVRVRLLYDTPDDVDKISAALKERICKYNKALTHKKFVDLYLYLVLRILDFDVAKHHDNSLTDKKLVEHLTTHNLWVNYVRELKRQGKISKSRQGKTRQWPTPKLISQLRAFSMELVRGRNYLSLLRRI